MTYKSSYLYTRICRLKSILYRIEELLKNLKYFQKIMNHYFFWQFGKRRSLQEHLLILLEIWQSIDTVHLMKTSDIFLHPTLFSGKQFLRQKKGKKNCTIF